MSIEITSRDSFEKTVIEGDFLALTNELNLAAAQGKQFVIFTEILPDGETTPCAVYVGNLIKARELPARENLIG